MGGLREMAIDRRDFLALGALLAGLGVACTDGDGDGDGNGNGDGDGQSPTSGGTGTAALDLTGWLAAADGAFEVRGRRLRDRDGATQDWSALAELLTWMITGEMAGLSDEAKRKVDDLMASKDAPKDDAARVALLDRALAESGWGKPLDTTSHDGSGTVTSPEGYDEASNVEGDDTFRARVDGGDLLLELHHVQDVETNHFEDVRARYGVTIDGTSLRLRLISLSSKDEDDHEKGFRTGFVRSARVTRPDARHTFIAVRVDDVADLTGKSSDDEPREPHSYLFVATKR